MIELNLIIIALSLIGIAAAVAYNERANRRSLEKFRANRKG